MSLDSRVRVFLSFFLAGVCGRRVAVVGQRVEAYIPAVILGEFYSKNYDWPTIDMVILNCLKKQCLENVYILFEK